MNVLQYLYIFKTPQKAVKRMSLQMKLTNRLERFSTWFSKTFLHPNDVIKTVYLLILVSIGCYGYTWINHGFTVPLSGDYTLQEMTFIYNGYDDWHTFFRTGSFPTWDRSVFLGIDNIGGNSFYYLFDPFFLILLPFPRDWLLVLQGLSFIPKMVLAGMFFYWYLGSFEFSAKTRRIGALAFGFSAYSFSYLWFHFIDSVAFLPLVLLGVERLIKNRDPRIFLIGFLLNAMTSYFFFVVFMIGAFLYAIFRFFQTIRERKVGESFAVIGVGFVSFVVAILLGSFTLLPGMATATSMPRVSSSTYLSNILEAEGLQAKLDAIFNYGSNPHSQVTPLLNFLFLYDDCYSSNLLNVYWYDNFAAGLYATTPMLLMFFVSFIDSIRNRKWSHIIALAGVLFLVFTPVGFYLFSGFTVGYARYFIIPIAWMIVLDCQAIERRREIPRNYLDLSYVITLALMILSCFLMIYEYQLEPSHFPESTNWDLKMVLIPASIGWVTLCYFVMRPLFHKKKFSKAIFLLSSIDIIVMANLTITFHGLSSASHNPDISEESKIVQMLKQDENNEDFYRIFNPTANRGNINISMREGYSGLGAFHSVYAYEAQNFIDRSRIPYTYHNWSMGIHNRRYNLETFLGTKYYLVDRVDPNYIYHRDQYSHLATPAAYPYYQDGKYTWVSDYDIPYGYKNVVDLTQSERDSLGVEYSDKLINYLKSDDCTKALYVNLDFVDFAFAYDQVINEYWLATSFTGEEMKPYYNAYEDENEYPLLRAAMLEDEDYQTFYKANKYQAGQYTLNGHSVNIEDPSKKINAKATLFRQSQVSSTTRYIEGKTAPIELWRNGGYTNSFKITIYGGQWPATERTPSGEYATCNPEDPYDTSCLEDYKKTHPWEYANGIYPADLKLDFNTLKDEDGNYHVDGRSVLYNSKIVIQPTNRDGTPTLLLPEADPNNPTTGGYISIFDDQDIEWRLFDENDKVISFGKHSYAEYKQAHGYYADRPVSKILGIIKSGTKTNPFKIKEPYLYVSRNKDYQSAIDNLRKEKVNILSRYDSEITFATNYSSDKFVVLNYAKTPGWNLYEVKDGKEEEVKIYKAQGGFIGFEGIQGEHTYVLRYSSPNFQLGMSLTALGLAITFVALLFFSRKNKYTQGLDGYVSFKNRKEEAIRKVKWDYVTYEDER